MKKIFVFGMLTIGLVTLVSFKTNQNQVPYLLTTLSPYSDELNLVSNGIRTTLSVNLETYAKIETGLEDLSIYVGSGKTRRHPSLLVVDKRVIWGISLY